MDTSNITTPSDDRAAYGGFWIRFAANAVDFVVLLIPTLLVSFLYRSTTPANNEVEELGLKLGDMGLNILIWWVYTAVLLSSSWQATVGKKVCGLRVVGYDGKRVSFGRATGRYFATFLWALTLGVGVFMIAWTRRKQGIHDFVANTLVVKHM